MIRDEFIRFVSTLTAAHIPDDVRQMAKLVLDHLDELMPLTTYQGHRVKKISELARANWDGLTHEIELVANAEVDNVVSISRLKSLQVGPFRGFLRQEDREEFDRGVVSLIVNATASLDSATR
jgi:DNA sulfur modification protein DndD